LCFLLGKARAEVSDFVDSVSQLLQTDVQMALLLFQVLALLVVELHILRNEV
jgi:hypothetical protein